VTTTQILSGSGEPSIKIHSTTDDDFALVQVLEDVHKLGCHHIVTDQAGTRAVSVGFDGKVKAWKKDEEGQALWKEDGEVVLKPSGGATGNNGNNKVGEVWAVALSVDGQYLAGTTHDGRVNVWDLAKGKEKIRDFETKGSFGMCVDMVCIVLSGPCCGPVFVLAGMTFTNICQSPDARFIASGHESGNIYVFSTATSRLLHSLPGLVKPVRAVKFSPGSSLLAAAGDARIISLYDPSSGEQVTNLGGGGGGHAAWITSLDWSHTGQYLLSGSLDGTVKVWDIERRTCVATHSGGESDAGLWCVKWLPRSAAEVSAHKAERFATSGSGKTIAIYREATGG
jgi:superkiller protein 8